MYIAISDDIIPRDPMGTAPRELADKEMDILHGLFTTDRDYLQRWIDDSQATPGIPAYPSYSKASSSGGQEPSVLAALAHELGHVVFADANADNMAHRNHNPVSNCFTDVILTTSWNGHHNPRRWIPFRDTTHGNTHKAVKPEVSDLVGLVRSAVNNNDDYTQLQQAADGVRANVGGEFVSLFAAISPEEDFIETYKFKVLKDRNIDLMLSLPPIPPINLPKTLSDSSPKVGCLRALGLQRRAEHHWRADAPRAVR